MSDEPIPYYSARQGRDLANNLPLPGAVALFVSTFEDLETEGYFQEWFGHNCDGYEGYVTGNAGTDVKAFFLRRIGRQHVWPVTVTRLVWDEDVFFDMVEVLHDCASQITAGREQVGGTIFMARHSTLEPASSSTTSGSRYRLNDDGRIEKLAPSGLAELYDEAADVGADDDRSRAAEAIFKFRLRSSTLTDRRDAVRDLTDVLERIQRQVKVHLLTEDEKRLFEIANKFWIRHNDEGRSVGTTSRTRGGSGCSTCSWRPTTCWPSA